MRILAKYLLITLLFLGGGVSWSQDCFPVKDEEVLVYDMSSLLMADQRRSLERKLQGFARETSNQIVVVITDDLCSMESWQYATELGEDWGVGQREQDNGIVIVVKPKTPEARGEVAMAIGRGLEGAIPDVYTKDIQTNEMIPFFQQNDYFTGIDKATDVLMELAKGEYNIQNYLEKHTTGKKIPRGVWIFLLLFFVFLVVSIRKTTQYARRNNLGWWAAWWLLN
ncbi:MAG: hypothetical protein RL220_47, partial [Bacteroidota bacterium]